METKQHRKGYRTMSKYITKIFDFIDYYRIIWFALLGCLFYSIQYTYLYYISITDISKDVKWFYELIAVITPFLGIFLWLLLFIRSITNQRYKKITKRKSFFADRNKYRKTYGELVKFYKNADITALDTKNLPEVKWNQYSGLVFGKTGKYLIGFTSDGNGIVSFVWGTPGVGKTVSVIIPSARQWGLKYNKRTNSYAQEGACMVLDLKGDIYEANKNIRRIKRFSMIDIKNSYHFDPLVNIRRMKEEDRAEALDNLAITVIPPEKDDNGTYFVDVAREFFTGIFLFCLHKDINISFAKVCELISQNSYIYWGGIIENSKYALSMRYTNKYKDENPKNVGGGYNKLAKIARSFVNPTLQTLLQNDDHCISPADLEDCIDVYIQVDPNKIKLYENIITMIFQEFMSAALYRKIGQNPPICFIIDEFGQLPMMPVIEQSAALMRAYNCSLLLCCQSLAMIDQHYGTEGRKILMDCAKCHCFLSLMEPDTRDWATRLIGKRKILKVNYSEQRNNGTSTGSTVIEAEEDIMPQNQFGILPDNHDVMICLNGKYIKASTNYYLE